MCQQQQRHLRVCVTLCWIVLAANVFAEQPTLAQDAPETECLSGTPSEAAVWRGSAMPSAERLAQCAAPLLWLSPDERYAWDGPVQYDASDCDLKPDDTSKPPHKSTVYYSVHNQLRSRPIRNLKDELPPDWDGLIRYFFLYRKDIGHCGDMEGVQLRFKTTVMGGSLEIRLQSVWGSAHGNVFMMNMLRVDRGLIRLPVTVLVEENKHASAPDRNGDGFFTPGHDLNVNLRDAWGLRDNFGDGAFAPGFDASTAKQTRAMRGDMRVFPRTGLQYDSCLKKRWTYYPTTVKCEASDPAIDWPPEGRSYQLKSTREIKSTKGSFNPNAIMYGPSSITRDLLIYW